jgi:hypothetical protein
MTIPASSPVEHGIPASGGPVTPRRSFLRRSRKRVPAGAWYLIAAFGVALLVVVAQLVLYSRRREPRDARAVLDRELATNTLRPGERVVRSVPVYRRGGAEYFRRTSGLLVLTDRRLVYLGAAPRDPTSAADAPPNFDQRDFRIDTLVNLKPSFAVMGLSRALDVESPEGSLELGVPSTAWAGAQVMRQAWDARQRRLRLIGAWGQRVRTARADLQKVLAEYKKQPVYHIVRAGDAISSIADWYETTPQEIAQLNGIVGNKIKVGQRLLIRSGK